MHTHTHTHTHAHTHTHTTRACRYPLPVSIDLVLDGSSLIGSPCLPQALAALKARLSPSHLHPETALLVSGSHLPPVPFPSADESGDTLQVGSSVARRGVVLGARGLVLAKITVVDKFDAQRNEQGADAGMALATVVNDLSSRCCD